MTSNPDNGKLLCTLLRTPAVDAPHITEEIVEPDADIIAERMGQVYQLLYDYSMDIRNF